MSEKIHLKVMVHHINLACGLWPYYGHTTKEKPWTRNKSKVTCEECKNSKPYKINNFSLKDV